MRNPQKFLDAKSSAKVAFSANSFEFENLVKISDGIIVRLRPIDPRPVVLQKVQHVVSKKRHQLSFSSPVSMNNVGRRFCGELPAISTIVKASYQTAKVHMKSDSRNFRLGQQDLSFKECIWTDMRKRPDEAPPVRQERPLWHFCALRLVWKEDPHTSHFLVFLCTLNSVAHDIGSRCVAHVIPSMLHAHCVVVVLMLFDSPLCTLHRLSHLLPHSPDLHLHPHLPCGSVRREVPCALSRMRSLTLLSITPLSQVMSPNSSTTTTSQRPLTFSSRSPPATAGPWTCTTRRSVTTPSAERSLHPCSLRSEKNHRAVDKLITLLKKVCCQVCRCLSVMLEQGDLFLISLSRWSQTSEKIHVATQKMSKSGFFWNDQKSRFSLIVEQRFRDTSSVSNVSEHTSPHVMSECQTPTQDQRCQSGPSARNSFVPSEGRFSKKCGADQQRLQISDPHFWQIHHVSNICLLEDKIQDWGMYLLTISYGSYAVDQRSGVGWISGWSKILLFCKRNSNARFWSIRCEDCFSTEPNHPQYPIQKKGQSGGNESPKKEPFPSWKTDRLPDLRVLPGHWTQRFCRELCRPIYSCSSKWWYSGIRFEMGRNSIINDANPTWWHLGRILQIKNTRVWETQDRIGIVQYGDSSEESRTWLSQIEDNGKKKYRAESTN